MNYRTAIAIIAAIFILVVAVGYATGQGTEQAIKITAKKFEFSPKEITLKKGVPATLEFTSLDRMHGFNCPGLKIRTDIPPGKVSTVRFVPDKTGTFPFHCDAFCGTGHEGMRGTIRVVE